MSRYGPVLCATDLGPSGQLALELAVDVAQAFGLPLHLVHATAPPPPEVTGEETEAQRVLRKRLTDHRAKVKAELERLSTLVRAVGVKIDFFTGHGRPWECAVEEAESRDASYLVVGPHEVNAPVISRAGMAERILGSTADRIVRHAPCPVIVGPRSSAHAKPLRGGPILASVDFSEASRRALLEAKRLGDVLGVAVIPMHVAPASWVDDPLIHELGTRDADALRAEVAETLGHPLEVRVAEGDPAETVAEQARDLGAHLVVMGTRGQGGLAKLLLGSVAERTLRRCPVPVMVTR
jgi:nucleotide-binding universal stress UspA family protein